MKSIEDLFLEVTKKEALLDDLPVGLMVKQMLTQQQWDQRLAKRSVIEDEITALRMQYQEENVIKPRVKQALKEEKAAIKKELFTKPPQRETQTFLNLQREILTYKKKHKTSPSYDQLWDWLKTQSSYQYDPMERAIIGLTRGSLTKENMRKNLNNYGYKGSK